MDFDKPLVSVCMIAYNHESFIKEAVEGVLMQETNFKVEFIISNDCSTDNTHKFIEQLITNNSNPNVVIKYHNQSKNLGMVNNFVYALKACKGKYIALCEGDDYWTDALKLQKQVNFLKSNTNYSFCWTRFNVYSQKDKNLTLDGNSRYFKNNDDFIDFDFEIYSKGWQYGTQTLMLKKDELDLTTCNHFEYFRDAHLIAQLLKINKGACLNFIGAVYRIHDGGVYTGMSALKKLEIAYFVNKEIYLDHKSNLFLKNKYLKSYKNYLNANINEFNFRKAYILSAGLFFKNGELLNFLRHIKRIIIKQSKQ